MRVDSIDTQCAEGITPDDVASCRLDDGIGRYFGISRCDNRAARDPLRESGISKNHQKCRKLVQDGTHLVALAYALESGFQQLP